jgi:NADH-quinone oxidoreductase subunit N
MINVVVSLYYYIQVVKAAFLMEPDEELPSIHLSTPATILTVVMMVVIVVSGIFPRYLFQLAWAGVQALH